MKQFAIIALLGSTLSPALLATANNCGTPAGTNPTYSNPTTPITLATANGNNGVVGFASGCEVINAVFNTFTVGTTTSGGGTNTPNATSGVNLLGALQTGTVALPNVLRLTFSPVTAADWQFDPDDSGTPDATKTTTITFRADIDTAVLANARFYGILGGGVTYSGFSSGDDLVLTTQVCSVVSGVCDNGAGDTLLGTHTMNLVSAADGTQTFGGMSFGGPQTTVYFRTQIVLTDNSNGGIDLSSFYLDLAQTPEPSSVLLMGAGLASLGLIARRRRSS